MVASPRRGSSLSRGLGRQMMKVLLLLVLFAGLLAATPTKTGPVTCGPAVKPKRDPTHPVASAMKSVAKGSGGGDFAGLSARRKPQRLQQFLQPLFEHAPQHSHRSSFLFKITDNNKTDDIPSVLALPFSEFADKYFKSVLSDRLAE